MSIEKIKQHTAFVYSEGRGCTHNHTRVWVIRKYHCQTTFMISRITTHTHTLRGWLQLVSVLWITNCLSCHVRHIDFSSWRLPRSLICLLSENISFSSSSRCLLPPIVRSVSWEQHQRNYTGESISDRTSNHLKYPRYGSAWGTVPATRTRRRKWRWNM